MDVPIRRRMTSAILAAAVLVGSAEALSAQAAPARGGQAAPPAIVLYRKAFMSANAQRMAALRALASGGEIGLGETELRDHVRRHATALHENAVLMATGMRGNYDLFPRGSVHPSSRATEKIWVEAEGGVGVFGKPNDRSLLINGNQDLERFRNLSSEILLDILSMRALLVSRPEPLPQSQPRLRITRYGGTHLSYQATLTVAPRSAHTSRGWPAPSGGKTEKYRRNRMLPETPFKARSISPQDIFLSQADCF